MKMLIFQIQKKAEKSMKILGFTIVDESKSITTENFLLKYENTASADKLQILGIY